MANTDVFQRQPITLQKPVTADMILIDWGGGQIFQATNINLQYSQQVQKRYTLGVNGQNTAVLVPTRPVGSLQIARIYADQSAGQNLFNLPGWNNCQPTDITISLDGAAALANCSVAGGSYLLHGAIVTSYGLSGDADSLQVVDNVTIEFLQLYYTPPSK